MLKKVVTQLDRVARSLDKKGLSNHASILCKLRDVVAAEEAKQASSNKLSDHASHLDALARQAHNEGLLQIASELCDIRDAVQATALDGPEGFHPVNTGEEGYPDDAHSEVAQPEAGVDHGGKQNVP